MTLKRCDVAPSTSALLRMVYALLLSSRWRCWLTLAIGCLNNLGSASAREPNFFAVRQEDIEVGSALDFQTFFALKWPSGLKREGPARGLAQSGLMMSE